MAQPCPAGTICSSPNVTPVGTSATKLYTYTSTQVKQSSDGKVSGGITTLYYGTAPNTYVPAATTTDGGKTWVLSKDSAGKPILGADAQKSLNEGALKTTTINQIKDSAQKAGIPTQQSQTLTGTQNQATTQEGSNNNGSSPSGDSATLQVADLEIPDAKDKVRQTYNDKKPIIYPEGLEVSYQDYIKFTMIRYKPKKFQAVEDPFNLFEQRNVTQEMGTVYLPIQSQISDMSSVDWGEDTLDGLMGFAARTSLGGMENPGAAVDNVVDTAGAVTAANGLGDSINKGMKVFLAGKASGAKGLLPRLTGAVMNQNLELLFNGPQLRSFTFNFLLSPRSKEEAIRVKKIIRFFKQGMSPKRAATDLFLKSPNIFKVQYIHGEKGTDHPSINRIKECALRTCNVEYTPNGSYMTFDTIQDEDATMTSYKIGLNFTELEPVYDDDFKDPDSPSDTSGRESIGY